MLRTVHSISVTMTLALGAMSPAFSQTTPVGRVYSLDELPANVRATAERVLAYHRQSDGARAAQALTLSDLMHRRLESLSKTESLGIPVADVELLRGAALTEAESLESIEAQLAARRSELCVNRRVLNATGMAQQLTSIQAFENEQLDRYYSGVLHSLSDAGQARVLQYLRSNVAPRMHKSTVDIAGLARAMPEQLAAQVEIGCSGGSAPPTTIEIEGASPDGTRLVPAQ